MKRITLCADDFAQSAAISEGILQLVAANRLGAVSCMTESSIWPEFARSLKAQGGNHQSGLHFNLTHGFSQPGQPVTRVMLLSILGQLDHREVRRRFAGQWQAFEEHYGQAPEFVDGHQHVHAFPHIRQIVIEETRQRNPDAWVRVPQASGWLPKVLVLRAMTAGFATGIREAGLAHNQWFAGFRPYHQDFDFAGFFRRLLATVEDDTLVMCHPGKAADDPTDPIAGCRQGELDYLQSEQFATDLAAANVRLYP